MLWGYLVRDPVPPGCKVVVNDRIDETIPLRVGRYDKVFFVSFDPDCLEVPARAPCKEGVVHTVKVTIRIAFQSANPKQIVEGAGHADYRRPKKVSVLDLADRQKVKETIAAIVKTYVQGAGFFGSAKDR